MSRSPVRHRSAAAARRVPALRSGAHPRTARRLAAAAGAATLTVVGLASPAGAAALLSNNFEAGAGSWTTSGGTWNVVTDGSQVLRQDSATVADAREVAGSADWGDFTLRARIKALQLPAAGSATAVLAHVTGSTSYDRVALLGDGRVQLQAVRNGAVSVLGTAAVKARAGFWYAIKLQESGSTVSAWVNGNVIGSGGTQAPRGPVGLQTLAAAGEFDDVSVYRTIGPVPPPPPPGGVDGYATVNGTTTGGAAGPTVTVTSVTALATAAAAPGAAVIKVSGSFSCTGDVVVSSDKTVLGVGAGSGLSGCGLNLKGSNNVVVRNLRISKVRATSGNGDAIHLDGSSHIWIDHNDLSSDLVNGKDFYDGLIDITHASDYVTVSWNHLHDHFKASLVGHSDSNAAEDTGHLRVTYHHNWFENINSRTPSLRFGTGHVYDNYFQTGDTGVHSRMGAQMLVQNNVFRGVATPIETTNDSKVDGFVNESGNDFGGGTNQITQTGSFTRAPYPVTLDPATAVVSLVTGGAGTGVIG